MQNGPIDAVVAWVDGQDVSHREKLSRYLMQHGIPHSENVAPTRFNQCGEIEYCILSLLRYAPWLRTIYIVTDNQVPSFLHCFKDTMYAAKVVVVDHRDIFSGFESCLPTFNSLSIESMLWRIPELSERFIYLNDDMMLLQPVSPNDFFRDDQCVIRGRWRTQSHRTWRFRLRGIKKTEIYRTAQEKAAVMAGWEKRYFHLDHAPFALKKTMFSNYFDTRLALLQKNASYPIRDIEQFWVIALLYHLALKQQNISIDKNLRGIYLHAGAYALKKIERRLDDIGASKYNAFLCVQSLDMASLEVQKKIVAALNFLR